MKRGIEMSWAYDYKDHQVLQIVKKRGNLTLEEIQDLIGGPAVLWLLCHSLELQRGSNRRE